MATISYKEIEQKLKELKEYKYPASEIGYKLLSAFGMTNTSIERVRSGKMNLAQFDGILVKKLLAYRGVSTEQLTTVIEEMKIDQKILKSTPRIIAVSDGDIILAFDPREKESYENKVSKLWLDFQLFYPLAGVEKYRGITENPADVKAAEKMAKLYDEIRCFNEITSESDVRELNIFMTRLLFCFFAEDTDIFEKNLFTGSIARFTKNDGSDLSEYLDACFNVMDQEIRIGISSTVAQFPYVNGGLFRTHISIPRLGMKARRIILECGELSWTDINPDIFGSMIQAVVSPEMRSGLGVHYTSVPNIMKLIGPLFLNDLYEAFEQGKDSEKKLNALLVRISKMKFFDPACGSGNFLIISYKEIRKLEIQIWKRIREITGQARIPYINIHLNQFYGIELDDFCHETAILSLWLAEHQMNKLFSNEFQVNIQALPLKPSGNIVCANACRIDWEDVCPHNKEEEIYIMGNPPYLGSKLQDKVQKKDIVLVFKKIKNSKVLDYISIWLYLGAKYIQGNLYSKYAFVSTNSICQGEQVGIIWPEIFNFNLCINFAHTSFKWANNAKNQAGVICVIVGVSNKTLINKKLYTLDKVVTSPIISPYLTIGNEAIVKKESKPPIGFPKMCFGCMPYDNGNLILSQTEKDEFINDYPEYSSLIKRLVGSQEFIRGEERYCLWISDNELPSALKNPIIAKRIENTRNFRLKSSDKAGVDLALRAHQFREFFENLVIKIIIPRVSSERREYIPVGLLDTNTIVSDSAFAIYDGQMWIFGFLTSKMHMAWIKTVGGRLKTDYRYSAQLCYNTFPFPKLNKFQKEKIEAAAEEILCVRAEYSEKTLAELYDIDEMPLKLREAHQNLDKIIDDCYRNEPFTSDEERLEHLFNLYEELSKNKV
ncbi:MAG: class I SAM-dependent DNA methyltransferase [Bacteroidales bacterium]|nr:class I SAM-dependent DNA methyltransferase [Bacteroidales bacterium]